MKLSTLSSSWKLHINIQSNCLEKLKRIPLFVLLKSIWRGWDSMHRHIFPHLLFSQFSHLTQFQSFSFSNIPQRTSPRLPSLFPISYCKSVYNVSWIILSAQQGIFPPIHFTWFYITHARIQLRIKTWATRIVLGLHKRKDLNRWRQKNTHL